MASLQDLLDFIQNKPPKWWGEDDWESNLTRSVPNWRNFVQDPDNWPAIERVRPRKSYRTLCELFIRTVGVDLAKRWFRSRIEYQEQGVRKWLQDVDNLSAETWNQLTDEMKEYVIYHHFEQYPGEPFDTFKDLTNCLEHLAYEGRFRRLPVQIVLSVPGYIPSVRVSCLRSIVKRAGDEQYLRLIDDMIAQREKACRVSQSLVSQRRPYTPTRDEQELIARMMEKVRRGGFIPVALPQIFLSFEAPPLFVAYPELEGEEEPEDRDIQPRIPRKGREKPKTISIEEVLGCYIPTNQQIILYARGLGWFARKEGLDEELLRAVVIVHEIGHWVSHVLTKPSVPEWPLELYKLTEEGFHEGWAQLITWWVVEEVGGAIKATFDKLNRSQPSPYKVYKKFKTVPVDSVMASLERLRQLSWPARVEDWERFCS